MPELTNVIVAINDLNENLERPQMPWPEVQPLPIDVPIPTKKPATTSIEGFATLTELKSPKKLIYKIGPINKKIKNNIKLYVWLLFFSKNILVNNPETPIIFPLESINNIAEQPINMPPAKDSIGVKLTQLIFII